MVGCENILKGCHLAVFFTVAKRFINEEEIARCNFTSFEGSLETKSVYLNLGFVPEVLEIQSMYLPADN